MVLYVINVRIVKVVMQEALRSVSWKLFDNSRINKAGQEVSAAG